MYGQTISIYTAMPLEQTSLKLDTVFNIFILSLSFAYLVHARQRHLGAKFQKTKKQLKTTRENPKHNYHRLFAKELQSLWTLKHICAKSLHKLIMDPSEGKKSMLVGYLLRCPLGPLRITFLCPFRVAGDVRWFKLKYFKRLSDRPTAACFTCCRILERLHMLQDSRHNQQQDGQ